MWSTVLGDQELSRSSFHEHNAILCVRCHSDRCLTDTLPEADIVVRSHTATIVNGVGGRPDRGGEVDRQVALVAAQLHARLGDITFSMREVLSTEIGDLGDQRLVELLGASCEGNVGTILHMLQHNISREHVEAPSAAFEYARRLAQQGVPVNSLVRAYRLGQDHLLKWSFDEIERQVPNPENAFQASQRVVSTTFNYIDWISQQVVAVYEDERERWLETRNVTRAARVRELVSGQHVDIDLVESAIGCSLRQRHVGLVLWVDAVAPRDDEIARMERFATTLGAHLRCEVKPITLAQDRSSVWVWFPFGAATDVDLTAIRKYAASHGDAPNIACGEPEAGINGFRETHKQALRAASVAVAAGAGAPSVVGFGESGVAAASLLATDVPATRSWVQRVLETLALDDDYHARLRETLRVFLAERGSYTAAADHLMMHKNSVKYRVAKVEEERGRPISEDRLDVELALLACRWLGPAVLKPAP